MEELLNKKYLTINDIKEITGIGRPAARKIIMEAREIAISKNYLLPQTNKLIAPTNIVRDLLKI